MDLNIALIGLVLLAGALIAFGLYLDSHQRSRAVPVIRQVYRPVTPRRYRW